MRTRCRREVPAPRCLHPGAPGRPRPTPHRLPWLSRLARIPFCTCQALGRKTKLNPASKKKLQCYSPKPRAGCWNCADWAARTAVAAGQAEEPTHLGATQPRGSSFARWPERTLGSFGDKTQSWHQLQVIWGKAGGRVQSRLPCPGVWTGAVPPRDLWGQHCARRATPRGWGMSPARPQMRRGVTCRPGSPLAPAAPLAPSRPA